MIEVIFFIELYSIGVEFIDFEDIEKLKFKEKYKGGFYFIKKRVKLFFCSLLKLFIKSFFKLFKILLKVSKVDEEFLIEDYKDIEKKISEKKIEEW